MSFEADDIERLEKVISELEDEIESLKDQLAEEKEMVQGFIDLRTQDEDNLDNILREVKAALENY